MKVIMKMKIVMKMNAMKSNNNNEMMKIMNNEKMII